LSGLTETDPTIDGIICSVAFTILTLHKVVTQHIQTLASVNWKPSIEAESWNFPLRSPFRSLSCVLPWTMWIVKSYKLVYSP